MNPIPGYTKICTPSLLGHAEHDLCKRIPAIYEQPTILGKDLPKPVKSDLSSFGMATVECPDTHCKCQIIGPLAF